jgi:hypothetical protein
LGSFVSPVLDSDISSRATWINRLSAISSSASDVPRRAATAGARHPLARLGLRLRSQQGETFLQTFDLPFGLFEVIFERELQAASRGRLRDLGQRFEELALRAQEITQFFDEQFLDQLGLGRGVRCSRRDLHAV